MIGALVNVPGLVVALLLTSPALYEAYENPAVDIVPILIRLVIVTVVMSLGISLVRELIAGYASGAGRPAPAPTGDVAPQRRASDVPAD